VTEINTTKPMRKVRL